MKVTTSGFVAFVVLLQEARTELASQTETMYFCNANLINLCTSFLSAQIGRLPQLLPKKLITQCIQEVHLDKYSAFQTEESSKKAV